jgi:hypothetical protein
MEKIIVHYFLLAIFPEFSRKFVAELNIASEPCFLIAGKPGNIFDTQLPV